MNKKFKIFISVTALTVFASVGMILAFRNQIISFFNQKPLSMPATTENLENSSNAETECSKAKDDFVKDYCYSILAGKTHDLNICNQYTKDISKDLCYSFVAQGSKDYSVCDRIENETYRQVCYEMVAEITQNLADCDKIPTPYTYDNENIKSLCYSNVGIAKNDLSICALVEFDNFRAGCYSKIAENKKDLAICDKIDLEGAKYYCYGDVAAAKKDVSICDAITGNTKDSCYGNVAASMDDMALCEKISEPGIIKDSCYEHFAEKLNDRTICDRMTEKITKDGCHRSLDIIAEYGGKAEIATTTPLALNPALDEDTTNALKSARDSGAQVIKENDASYEIIDKPLPKWDFPQKYYGKTVDFAVKSVEAEGQTYTVTLDPESGDYRATMDISGNFYLVNSNGIICYGRPSYQNTYCVREKYTPLAMVRYFLGQKDIQIRELSEDESELQRLMNDYGWLPDNIMAAIMSAAELAFSQLAQDKLATGTNLVWTSEDGKDTNTIGTVMSLDFSKPRSDLKTKGIHLTYLMADIYNSKDNPKIWDKPNDTFHMSSCDMENGDSDKEIEDFFAETGFKKESYYISQ